MYYIVSQTDHIFAADHALLALLNAKDIEDLYAKIALKQIRVERLTSTELLLDLATETLHYTTEETPLSTIFGELTIVRLCENIVDRSSTIEEEESVATDEPEELYTVSPAEESATPTEPTEESLPLEEALYNLKELHQTDSNIEQPTEELVSPDEEFSLADTTADIALKEESTQADITEYHTQESIDDTPIVIDIYKVSQEIGITPDEYNRFLNEYIDVAIDLEDDLHSTESTKQTSAIETLKHLSDLLHITQISKTIDQIALTEASDRESNIAKLYSILSKITIDWSGTSVQQEPAETESSDRSDTFDLSSFPTEERLAPKERLGTIDLSDVEPIHFDFQLSDAANELGLPLDLIKEFIHDFIRQSKEETAKMLEAYERGDLKSIQDIAHLLKGAAANLRITPLADTLYQIQLCSDSDQLDTLIKNYWAHFLSFEKQMNLISN